MPPQSALDHREARIRYCLEGSCCRLQAFDRRTQSESRMGGEGYSTCSPSKICKGPCVSDMPQQIDLRPTMGACGRVSAKAWRPSASHSSRSRPRTRADLPLPTRPMRIVSLFCGSANSMSLSCQESEKRDQFQAQVDGH